MLPGIKSGNTKLIFFWFSARIRIYVYNLSNYYFLFSTHLFGQLPTDIITMSKVNQFCYAIKMWNVYHT